MEEQSKSLIKILKAATEREKKKLFEELAESMGYMTFTPKINPENLRKVIMDAFTDAMLDGGGMSSEDLEAVAKELNLELLQVPNEELSTPEVEAVIDQAIESNC